MLKRIGGGEFGEVWQGLWNSKFEVAVRTCRPGSVTTDDFFHEAEILVSLPQHPNIIKLHAVCLSEPHYIVYEYMSNRGLGDYLRSDGRNLRLPVLIDMCSQIAKGMCYLEANMCIHRDLRAGRVLVNENNVCKVSGFKIAFIVGGKDSPLEITKLPIKWTAPEAACSSRFSSKSDVWSFGIVLYEAVTNGQTPYPGMKNQQVLEALVHSRYRMPCPIGCPDRLYDIMLNCWSEEPDSRPTFETLQWQLEEFYTVDDSGYSQVES